MRIPGILINRFADFNMYCGTTLRRLETKPLLLIFPILIALVFQLNSLGTGGHDIIHDEDGRQYYNAATALKQQGMFADPYNHGIPYSYRMPLYPVFLSLFAAGNENSRLKRTALALDAVSLALIFLAFIIAKTILPGALALAATSLFAVSGSALKYGSDVEVQGFFALTVAVFALCGLNYLKKPGALNALLWGISAGLCLQVRSVLFAIPVICAVLMFREKGGYKHTAVFFSALFLLLAPWAARNYYNFGEFIPFEKNAPLVNMYTATLGVDECVNRVKIPNTTKNYIYWSSDADTQALIIKSEIRGNLAAFPGVYFKGVFRRFIKYLFKFPFLLPGLLLCFIKKEKAPVFLGLVCLYYIGVHATMSMQGRYLFPVIPIIYAVSFYGLYAFWASLSIFKMDLRLPAIRTISLFFLILGSGLYAKEVWYLYREIKEVPRDILGSGDLRAFTAYSSARRKVNALEEVLSLGEFGERILRKRVPSDTRGLPREARELLWKKEAAKAKLFSDAAVKKIISGDLTGAECLLLEALRLDPANPEVLMNLCSVRTRENKKEEALEACQSAMYAVYLDPNKKLPEMELLAAEASFTSYELLKTAGRMSEAKKALCRAVDYAPPAWTKLAKARAELKNLK